MIRKNYPVTIGNKAAAGLPTEQVSVVGPLCTPLTCWATKWHFSQIGELVVVFQSGAYGFTASPTRFLSHAEPVEVLTTRANRILIFSRK